MIDPDKKPPFTAYTLTKNYGVKKVVIVSQWGWDNFRTESYNFYHYASLFESVEDAVAAGREKINKRRASLEKQLAQLPEKLANLEKYEAAK